MNIVIADDERLSRINLLHLIEELGTPWKIVGEADNGEDLVKLVEAHRPDIGIVDIRMPKMDGLEAIKACVSRSPLTKWIILSGFSDFTYAQQALRMGVSEYLLKPVRLSDLEIALDAVSQENKQYRMLLNKQFENDLVSLFHGLSSIDQEPADSIMRKGIFAGCLLYFDSVLSCRLWTEWQREFNRAVKSFIHENVCKIQYSAFIAMPGGELALIGACDAGRPSHAGQDMDAFKETVNRLIRQFEGGQVIMTVLHSGVCESYEMLEKRLERLRCQAYLRSVLGIGRQWEYISFEEAVTNVPDTTKEIASQLIELVQAFRDEEYLSFQNGTAGLEKKWKLAGWPESSQVPGNIASFICSTMGISKEEAPSMKALIAALNRNGEQLLEESRNADNRACDIIDQVISVIESKYMEDIGLGQIASELNITQNYLCTLFHKKTGMTFMKYLTRTRMLTAKKLLCETNMQVGQVANRVGYYSTRHFSKLFKEAVGCHPSEYRRKRERPL
ncbi:helix-turn-helix domain-containing protein [Paenibacillus tarimensis]